MNLRPLLLLLLISFNNKANNFDAIWYETQDIHSKLIEHFREEQKNYDEKYLIPGWRECQNELSRLIQGNSNPAFLHHKTIIETMRRIGYGAVQTYELNHIRYFLSPANRSLLFSYKDTNIGGISFDIPEINCGANSLSQIYALSHILENNRSGTVSSLLEWGGGFGSLARITKSLLPDVTYFIIDLIPLLAIQHLYLKASLPDIEIKVHYEPSDHFEKGCIHLIPVYLLDKINIQADNFVSMFALTECPYFIQNEVTKRNFFNASTIYLSGITHDLFNAHGVKTSQIYESELIQHAKNIYSHCFAKNHHTQDTGSWVSHFELIAAK